jgi:hypothetical protein
MKNIVRQLMLAFCTAFIVVYSIAGIFYDYCRYWQCEN